MVRFDDENTEEGLKSAGRDRPQLETMYQTAAKMEGRDFIVVCIIYIPD